MQESKTILIVDDDADVVRGASVRLRAAGYRTIAAEDGTSGIAAVLQRRPDAVVLDVRMPDMDGLTALERLQENEQTKNIPIVMLSASVSAQQAALERGARFFLTKPYQGLDLVQAINKAIEEAESNPPEQSKYEP